MKIQLKIVKNKNWDSFRFQDKKIWYAGDVDVVKEILKNFFNSQALDIQRLKRILLNSCNKFSFIFMFHNKIICCTDIIRSYPIFYSKNNNKVIISNNDRALIKKSTRVKQKSLIDCFMSGYTHGNDTLYDNIKSMLPAEIIFSPMKFSNSLKIHKYFLYNFTFKKGEKKIDCLNKELEIKFNKIILKLIKKANGRQIVVPLSGGLDSRLIICKLHQFKYKNIVSFTYGLKNNSDVKNAEIIAKSLGIRWRFVPFNKIKFKKYYYSNFKKEYDLFADNSSSLPNYQDVFFIKELLLEKYIDRNSIIVNGQTGDFITGGHIPTSSKKKNFEYFKNEISSKHFSLFKKFNNSNMNEYLKVTLKDFIKKRNLVKPDFDDLIELWNFEERQAKYIINGQRAYEFLNLDWYLPFWDSELIKFWNKVPNKFKVSQKLFKEYLKTWNYKNLFTQKLNEVHAFTGVISVFVRFFSILLNIFYPLINKKKILAYFDYYSRYGYMYNFFSLFYFLKNRSYIKNAFSLHTLKWLIDLGLKKEIEILNKKFKFLKI